MVSLAPHRSGILFLLQMALLAQSGWAQRIGPLIPDNQQRARASLAQQGKAAVRPPSLKMNLPPPAAAALPPLGPDDLQLLRPQGGRPPVIGVHRPLPQGSVALSFSAGTARTTAEGAWQAIPTGRLWRLRITSPSARAMRVRFRDFAIGAGKLWLYSADGQVAGPYTGSGLYGDGNFWSGIVSGDSLTIEYLPDPAATQETVPFQIVEISHIWGDAFGNSEEAEVQAPTAASGGAWAGREAVKPPPERMSVAVRRQTREQSPAADDPSDTKTAQLAKQIPSVERSASLQHSLLQAAAQIAPGLPIDFRVGPVSVPKLFAGANSFRLLVPPSATSATFTLACSVDVDLHVRYGEDNDFRNERVVSDYSSAGPTGNEEIVVTPQSDPPLRAGTYFISIALSDTGVAAACTLEATMERDAALPPISGGLLTPGQPAAFRLGPLDRRTVFTGDDSFRLLVPEGATRVIFTLESVDPRVDVDLLVRYGEDNALQNGEVVFDHVSASPAGNERIGITRRSAPPLRAGTYFVSIVVFDTGMAAEGTVTAVVETDVGDCHLDATCYPEWSSSAAGAAYIVIERSGGFSATCSGTLLNNRREDSTPYFLTAAHCAATEEEARSMVAHWFYQTQTCNGDLPDLQSLPRTMGASLLSTVGGDLLGPRGDMTLLRIAGDLPDGVMFQGWDADPPPLGAQVTGIHHPANVDWGRFKRISFGQVVPDPERVASEDVYAVVSYTRGYTQGGSSGSALFSSPGAVVGALSFGSGSSAEAENACRSGNAFPAGYTHFSVFYPQVRMFVDSLTPGITGGPLAAGEASLFHLDPVGTPRLFSGHSSFQVEVPESANHLIFTLNSSVDMDLYVRYGEDNDFRNGSVVSDHSSTGPTGNEEIIVTRESDPPLRAGTYFISVAVSDTGVVAKGTVKVLVSDASYTPPPTGNRVYYFPHLGVGAGWQTTFTYINHSPQEVRCQTFFIENDGTPLPVSFEGQGTVFDRTDVLPPGGSVHQETNVELSTPLATGWAHATCTGPVKAGLLFRQYNGAGVPTGEAGVNAATVLATRFVSFAEQGQGRLGTGVAYANPSAREADITFTVRDEEGQVLASDARTLPPGGHGEQNMADLFDLGSFSGSLEITSTQPIVSLALNAEASPVFSSLPPGEVNAAPGATTYYFPHLAVGNSWQTTLTYINYSSEPVSCQTELLSDDGVPLLVPFAGLGTVAERTDMLPPGGTVHQETNVELNAPLAAGWARATCSGPVKASLLFRQYDSAGVPTGEAGVNAATVLATRFVSFAEQGQGRLGTGVAYANPSAREADITFTVRDEEGQVLASDARTLPPGGHGEQNMADLFDLGSFSGSLEITSTQPIVSLALNAEASPVFSSLPPGELE